MSVRIHYRPIKAAADGALLGKIKQFIKKFYDTNYGTSVDFSDMSKVPVIEDYDGRTDKVVSRVLLDLNKYQILYEENGKIKKALKKFTSLPEMWKALQQMNFDDFQSMSVFSSKTINASKREYNNEVKNMRIYANKKRPVKASNDGRKWVNTEVTKEEWEKLGDFLYENGYQYEPSEAYNMVHVECYLNDDEIKKVDAFIDTITASVKRGRKSVKASEQADDIVMYWGGSKVYEGPADGSMTREIKWFLDDPECLQQIVDYCNSFGDPVITDTSDLMDVAATFVQLVGYEISEAEAMGDDVYISDDLGSFEIFPASQEVTSSVKRGRKSVKASRTLEIFTFDELTPEQQEYVLSNWSNMNKLSNRIYEWYNEDLMLSYPDEIQYIADQYASKYGLSINPDKIYWQESSQGPYPEWDFSQVFNEYTLDDEYHTGIYFYGKGFDVHTDIDTWEDETLAPMVEEVEAHAQEFINEVWGYIESVCQSYPDDEWVRGEFEANPDAWEFTVGADGTVKYY